MSNIKKMVVVVGHSKLKNGNITSADGIVNEYAYCKSLGEVLKNELVSRGVDCDYLLIPEGLLNTSKDEKKYKLDILNSKKYDLIIELHLNSFSDSSANGTEVYYSNSKVKTIANNINKNLSTLFRNRKGTAQIRNDWYMLSKNNNPTILLETFFCTNMKDTTKGIDMEKIAVLISDAIARKKVSTPPKKIYRVQVGAYSKKSNAENMLKELKKIGIDGFIL